VLFLTRSVDNVLNKFVIKSEIGSLVLHFRDGVGSFVLLPLRLRIQRFFLRVDHEYSDFWLRKSYSPVYGGY